MSYEPTGIFRQGFSLTELEAMAADMKKVFTEDNGEQIQSWTSPSHQVMTRFALTADQMWWEIMFALQSLDPDKYPTAPDRTVVAFSDNEVIPTSS